MMASAHSNEFSIRARASLFGKHQKNAKRVMSTVQKTKNNKKMIEVLRKKRFDFTRNAAKECVEDCIHSNLDARIDTNSFAFVNAANDQGLAKKHPCRMWNAMNWDNRLSNFLDSGIYEQRKSKHPHLSIAKTVFRSCACKCTKEPTDHSCVDAIKSSVNELQLSLASHLSNHTPFRKALRTCTCPLHWLSKPWDDLLWERPEDLIELSICVKKNNAFFQHNNSMPKTFSFSCVSARASCGIAGLSLASCALCYSCSAASKVRYNGDTR